MDIDPAAAEPVRSVALKSRQVGGISTRGLWRALIFPESIFRPRSHAFQQPAPIAVAGRLFCSVTKT